ncbi:MAG: hypothetical protein QM704_02320 [Anaeromyxobacteraceae bacterium]
MTFLGLVIAAVLAAPPPPADAVAGTYRVRATVRMPSVPVLGTVELRGDVVLRPGPGPGGVSARLAARGHACALEGRVREGGAITFAPGQACTIALDDPGARGQVRAVLRGARAGVDTAGRITLALELELSGSVRVSTGLEGIPGLAGEAEVPVSGPATVDGAGDRDNSRAGE